MVMNEINEGLKQSFKRERAGSGQMALPPRTRPTSLCAVYPLGGP
jgi:hypothetical protein